MRKRTILLMTICVLLVIVGVTLFILGVVNGGKTGIYFKSWGQVYAYDINSLKTKTILPNNVKKLELDVSEADVKVYPSDTFKIEILYYEDLRTVEVIEELDSVKIVVRNTYDTRIDLLPFARSEIINIMVPNTVNLDTLKVQANVSSFSLDRVPVQDLQVDIDVGSINIKDTTGISSYGVVNVGTITLSNSQFNTIYFMNHVGNISLDSVVNQYIMTLATDTGSIQLNDVNTSTLYMDVDVGSIKGSKITTTLKLEVNAKVGGIDVSGVFEKTVALTNDVGDIRFRSTAGTAIKYNYDVEVNLGEIQYNNTPLKNKDFTQDTGETNEFVATTNLGNIYVNAR